MANLLMAALPAARTTLARFAEEMEGLRIGGRQIDAACAGPILKIRNIGYRAHPIRTLAQQPTQATAAAQ
jgi:hypothetical protein